MEMTKRAERRAKTLIPMGIEGDRGEDRINHFPWIDKEYGLALDAPPQEVEITTSLEMRSISVGPGRCQHLEKGLRGSPIVMPGGSEILETECCLCGARMLHVPYIAKSDIKVLPAPWSRLLSRKEHREEQMKENTPWGKKRGFSPVEKAIRSLYKQGAITIDMVEEEFLHCIEDLKEEKK
jgi:hypothetical protein